MFYFNFICFNYRHKRFTFRLLQVYPVGVSEAHRFLCCLCSCDRLDRPRGGSGVQRLHALASRQPALGRPELQQGKGLGGDEHRPFLAGPQDALVAAGHLWARRARTPHPAGAAAMDLPLFGPLLPRPGAPKQPQPGQ